MTAVRFTARAVDYTVAFAYNPGVVQLLKDTVPGYARSWVAARKEWQVDRLWVDALASTLSSAGHTVVGYNTQPPPRPRGSSDDLSQWAHLLFKKVRADRRQAVYRALSKCLHPDVGGDPGLQRELNDAFDQAKGN